MPNLLLAAQDSEAGLALWQAGALFVGVPAAAVAVIVIVVLKIAPPSVKGAFPVLRPEPPTADDEPPCPAVEPPESPVEPAVESAASEADLVVDAQLVAPLECPPTTPGSGDLAEGTGTMGREGRSAVQN